MSILTAVIRLLRGTPKPPPRVILRHCPECNAPIWGQNIPRTSHGWPPAEYPSCTCSEAKPQAIHVILNKPGDVLLTECPYSGQTILPLPDGWMEGKGYGPGSGCHLCPYHCPVKDCIVHRSELRMAEPA